MATSRSSSTKLLCPDCGHHIHWQNECQWDIMGVQCKCEFGGEPPQRNCLGCVVTTLGVFAALALTILWFAGLIQRLT
jgi:hypothetical protein